MKDIVSDKSERLARELFEDTDIAAWTLRRLALHWDMMGEYETMLLAEKLRTMSDQYERLSQ